MSTVTPLYPASAWELPLIDATLWYEKEPPARRFVVDGWLARATGALLVGEDGVGKSLLAQQLATCVAAGRSFLGLNVEHAGALYVSCEDDENELWRRQRAINQALGVPIGAAPAMLSSLVGHTNVELGFYDQNNQFRLSPVALGIVACAKERGAALIVLDNLAHFFPGNENVRHDVAAFCAAIERMAIDADATVLILAHPSKAGAEYSGSTGWSAHVRQRWYMERDDVDRDSRTLRKSKANYAESGTEVRCRWMNWAFVNEADLPPNVVAQLAGTAQAAAENDAFLRCLAAATERRQAVSHNPGVNYAPNIFRAMPEGKGFKEEAFKNALQRLLAIGKIELDQPVWKRENRAWKFGIKASDQCTDPSSQVIENTCTDPAPTPRTDPHTPPAQVIDFTCTDLHAPTPLCTTYITGAAPEAAAPDDPDPLSLPPMGGGQ
ncbi:AAA family ATPase [Sphingomonas flavalba]|uniref:AAA family ATPase n=1 Tax=Sphingomonas flavalba TaxID=2559804 RepID=UPI0039E025D3